MSMIENIKKNWPQPSVAQLPIAVRPGRSWRNISTDDLAGLIGLLFVNTDAQAVRIQLTPADQGRFDLTVQGSACPSVPYATLSGEHLSPFLAFDNSPRELWVHCENWFWVNNLDDGQLENLFDRFISSM